MSMLSHQIEQLKDLRFRMGTSDKHNPTDWTLIDGAIDTIEVLSAKLSAANTERSERYYGGGWIACENRLPEKSGEYIATDENGEVTSLFYEKEENRWVDSVEKYSIFYPSAWQPLPSPYNPDKE